MAGTQLLASMATGPTGEHSAKAEKLLDVFFDEEKEALPHVINGEAKQTFELTTTSVPSGGFHF